MADFERGVFNQELVVHPSHCGQRRGACVFLLGEFFFCFLGVLSRLLGIAHTFVGFVVDFGRDVLNQIEECPFFGRSAVSCSSRGSLCVDGLGTSFQHFQHFSGLRATCLEPS